MGSNVSVERPADVEVRDVLDSFRRIVRALRESSRHSEADTGLSSAQLFVLQVVAEAESLSIGEIAARTHTHQSSVSVVVQRLVDRGLLRLRQSKEDARRRVVGLTSHGRALARTAADPAQVRLVAAISALSDNRRGALAGALRDVVAGMSLDRTTPEMFFEEPVRRKGSSRR